MKESGIEDTQFQAETPDAEDNQQATA